MLMCSIKSWEESDAISNSMPMSGLRFRPPGSKSDDGMIASPSKPSTGVLALTEQSQKKTYAAPDIRKSITRYTLYIDTVL